MYVIRFRIYDELPYVYFDFLEPGFIHYSADITKAMLFYSRSDAFIMAGLVSELVYNLEFTPHVLPVAVDHEDLVDDDTWFTCEYVCDD